MSSASSPSFPVGTVFVLLLTAVLYVVMLAKIQFSPTSGDAAVGVAATQFVLLAGVWILLAILLIVGGVKGDMPGFAAVLLVLLLPLSGWATLAMLDQCMRGHVWAASFHVVLPVLLALYALWARFEGLHGVFPPVTTSATLLGGVFVLSIVALGLAGPG